MGNAEKGRTKIDDEEIKYINGLILLIENLAAYSSTEDII